MRIKLDKMVIHIGLEIYMLSKSMPPLETFVAYRIHLSLSSCCIEDWAFSEKSVHITAILLSVFTFLHTYTQKPKTPFYIIFPDNLTNQYLQLLVSLITFSISKGTTIDLLHLGVIIGSANSP
jgi:hypothetical protein